MRSIKDVALAFNRACEAADVTYALVGGFAVMAWGLPRATRDVDALVRLRGERIESFVRACKEQGLQTSREDVESALAEGGHVSVFDLSSSYHVDVKPARTAEEEAQVISAMDVRFPEGRLRVARPEHTVAYKLLFGRPQDLADARSIVVRQQGKLRWEDLRSLCRRLRVTSRLNSLLKELDIGRPK